MALKNGGENPLTGIAELEVKYGEGRQLLERVSGVLEDEAVGFTLVSDAADLFESAKSQIGTEIPLVREGHYGLKAAFTKKGDIQFMFTNGLITPEPSLADKVKSLKDKLKAQGLDKYFINFKERK
ncbi:MAG: hypothetical protein P4L74_05190 [Candidatus Doudnabacteria bacterium]|nr:hypothetical protein [Candidatus Doudnabacteria bacterium]